MYGNFIKTETVNGNGGSLWIIKSWLFLLTVFLHAISVSGMPGRGAMLLPLKRNVHYPFQPDKIFFIK